MQRIASGISRLIFTALTLASNYNTFKKMKVFETFSVMNGGEKTGAVLIMIFVTNVTIYMTINAIMDFKNKPIKFKAMYILFSLDFLGSLFKLFPLQKVSLWWALLMVIFITIALFFVINDFIQLWFKRPKKGI
ncbi:MAG: hypothetical protein ACHQHN_04740 [Sphingobacteriales bacterium]